MLSRQKPGAPGRSGLHGARAALRVSVGLAFVAAAVPLRAQPVALSLAQALELAEKQNPEIRAQRARAEAEAARADAAGRMSWPRLTLSSRWSYSNTPSTVFAQKLNSGEFAQDDFAIDRLNSPNALSHLTTALAAELPLDAFGALKARTRTQAAGARAAQAGSDEALQELRLRVVEAYRRAALAERVTGVAERSLAAARAREDELEARVDEGASLRADLLRVRARRRQREAELAERRSDAEIAVGVLARAVGTDPQHSYRPSELPAAPPPLEGDCASWLSRAQDARPSLRLATERLEAQAWSVRAEERAGRPELAAWGQFQDDRNAFSSGGTSGALGVSLKWYVLDPARGRRVAAAAAEARAADLEVQAARDQLRLEVETAWRRAHAARERYAASAGGAEEGREALRVVQERRQQGLATLTDELETEAASLAAELDELRVATEAAIADATLRRAAGGL
jgi:outer membrane protein TolC